MKISSFRDVILTSVAFVFSGSPAMALEGAVNIHDPSKVVLCDGRYYVFGTGRGMRILTSGDGFTWESAGMVFEKIPGSVRSYVPLNNGTGVWAPDIIQLNGEYYLYYAVSHWGQYVSAIGLMTNPTLDPKNPVFKWKDRGMVVHSVEGQKLNAIDPGVLHAPDGTLWLCYGSYYGNIELVQLDPKTGLRLAPDSKVTIIASHSEAADLLYHDGFYYLMVNHGTCCKGKDSTYHILAGRSKSVTGPYLDRNGVDLAKGGGTLFLKSEGNQIGPGHFGLLVDDGVEKFSCHYEADLIKGGRSVLDIRPLLWSADGWPLPGRNPAAGAYQVRPGRAGDPSPSGADVSGRNTSQWTITPAGGGFFRIAEAKDGRALESASDRVTFAPPRMVDSQLWKLDQLSDGSYRVASKVARLALTATNPPDAEPELALQPFNGGDGQRWVFTPP